MIRDHCTCGYAFSSEAKVKEHAFQANGVLAPMWHEPVTKGELEARLRLRNMGLDPDATENRDKWRESDG